MKSKKAPARADRLPFAYPNKSLFLCIAILAVSCVALFARNADILLMNAFFIPYLITGILQTPVADGIRLSAQREVGATGTAARRAVEVRLAVCNGGDSTVCVSVDDTPPGGERVTDGSPVLAAALAPGARAEIRYVFESARGGYSWDPLVLRVSDPLGCAGTEFPVSAPAEIFVQPRYPKCRPFGIRPRRTLSSPGCIPTRQGGNGTDFRGIREYRSGDPLKSLDWRMTARHPGEFFTREFEQERTAEIVCVVDARKSMELASGNDSLFEAEIRSVASLSEMFLRQGQRVGVYVAGDAVLKAPPAYGKRQLHRILNCLSDAKTGGADSPVRLECLLLERFSPKAVVFVFSPYDSDDLLFYRMLRSRGFQVVLVCPDPFDFAFRAYGAYEASEGGRMALRAARIERKLHLSLLSQLSISVIDWKVGEPLFPSIRTALSRPASVRML